MTDGISTENVNMQEYSSNYYDMVARPEIKKKKIYRRVFIRRETKAETCITSTSNKGIIRRI